MAESTACSYSVYIFESTACSNYVWITKSTSLFWASTNPVWITESTVSSNYVCMSVSTSELGASVYIKESAREFGASSNYTAKSSNLLIFSSNSVWIEASNIVGIIYSV